MQEENTVGGGLEQAVLNGGIDWAGLASTAQENGIDIAMVFGKNLLIAIAIYYVGKLAVSMLVRGMRKVMQARDVDKTLEVFLCNLVRMALMVIVIIAAIGQLGVETASFIGIFAAAGLAVGLALQGSLSNFAAGVLIVLFRPYRVGDFVEAAGISGVVEQVQILTTVLRTGDNKQVIVPNGQIMDSIVTNYSAKETRRVDMVIGVSYSDDLDKVRKTLQEIIAADDRILDDPEPLIAVAALADSSVNFNVRPWVKTADYWAVLWDLTEAIKKRFDQENISFPFPQQDVHLYKAD
jgi:small conductance mechanosensitive channel